MYYVTYFSWFFYPSQSPFIKKNRWNSIKLNDLWLKSLTPSQLPSSIIYGRPPHKGVNNLIFRNFTINFKLNSFRDFNGPENTMNHIPKFTQLKMLDTNFSEKNKIFKYIFPSIIGEKKYLILLKIPINQDFGKWLMLEFLRHWNNFSE